MNFHQRFLGISDGLNARLERLMPILAPTGVVLGYLFPHAFIWLRPFVPWLFALTTLSGALKLKARELGGALKKPAPILLYFFSSHGIIPVLVFFLGGIIFGDNTDTIAGFVLLYASPAAVTALIWVSVFRGESALALALILLAVITAPLVMPGTVYLLLGARVSMDLRGMIISLIIMVVIPTILGVTGNEMSRGKIPDLICPYISPLSKLLVVVIMAGNVSAAAHRINFDSPILLLMTLVYVCFTALSFLCAKFSGILAGLDPPKRVSFLFIAGMRNSVATATIAISFFPEAVAQPAIIAMLLQQTMAAFMGKILLRRN